jgi:hypothetical protein
MNEDAEEMGDPADYIPAAYRDDDWAILCDQLLAPLPDIERRVFIAREKEGKTFAEIGAEFNCTDEWARKKYHRARELLPSESFDADKQRRRELRLIEGRPCYLLALLRAHDAKLPRAGIASLSCSQSWHDVKDLWSGMGVTRKPPPVSEPKKPWVRVYSPDEIATFLAKRPDLQTEPDLHSEHEELLLAA